MLLAEFAVLVEFQPFGRHFLVFHRIVVTIFALRASQLNLISHISTSIVVYSPNERKTPPFDIHINYHRIALSSIGQYPVFDKKF